MKDNPLSLDGWKYDAGKDELGQLHLAVESPNHKELPSSLYKLTEVSAWSFDSLDKSYLYGPHPWYFNDLFDCHKDLILSDDPVAREFTLGYMKDLYKGQLDDLTPDELEERIHESRTDMAYIAFGLVCMTPKPDNILMWAYYGNNKGFMVEYDYTQFGGNFYGPFPINYQDTIQQISLKEHGDRIATLYQSLVKSKRWEHEDEWRFLCMSDEGKILQPFNTKPSPEVATHDRKFKYPTSAVKSISLGNRFFDIDQMTIKNDILHVKFKDEEGEEKIDYRKKILDIVLSRNIDVRIAMKLEDMMRIGFKNCNLEKLDELNYRFTYKV